MHWVWIVLIVLSCCVVLVGVLALIYRYTAPVETPCNIRDGIYTLLNRFHTMAEKENIRYSITCGTLLGAVRHKSIVPNDDDGDLVMAEEDIHVLTVEICERYGMVLKNTGDIWTIKLPTENPAHVDIFRLTQLEPDRWTYAGDYPLRKWPKEYFLPGELWPTQLLPFGPLKLHAPNNPEPFLTRAYGPDWSKEMVITTLHHGGILRYLKWNRRFRPKEWKAYPPSASCTECLPLLTNDHKEEEQFEFFQKQWFPTSGIKQ